MIPSQTTASSGAPRDETGANQQGSLLSSGLDAEPVNLYAQGELTQVRNAREAFESEKRASEHALEQRRAELDRQSKLLVARLQELHEREQRLSEELEDALPERLDEYPRRVRIRPDAGDGDEAHGLEFEMLRRQMREQQMSLELLSAERDAAWSQLQQFRDQQHDLDRIRAERDALAAQLKGESPAPIPDEAAELRKQIETLQQQQTQFCQQRDEAWSFLQELPERVQQLDQARAERDEALAKLRTLTEQMQTGVSEESEWVDLDTPHGEKTVLRIQLGEQKDIIQRLKREVEETRAYAQQVQDIPANQVQEIMQLRAERDAALAQVRQFSMEPAHWAQEESEFAAQRLQLKQEQRRLTEHIQDLHRREAEMNRRSEQVRQEVVREKQRLDELSQDLANLTQQLREDRNAIEAKEREIRLRDAQAHLREAEIREMIEIAELDAARERSELNQERLKLARLREAMRLEREALRGEHGKLGRPPSKFGI